MKKFFKEIVKHLKGVFIPQDVSDEPILADIQQSIEELEFIGPENDKKNIKKDISAINRDFNKATREAKIKFELSL